MHLATCVMEHAAYVIHHATFNKQHASCSSTHLLSPRLQSLPCHGLPDLLVHAAAACCRRMLPVLVGDPCSRHAAGPCLRGLGQDVAMVAPFRRHLSTRSALSTVLHVRLNFALHCELCCISQLRSALHVAMLTGRYIGVDIVEAAVHKANQSFASESAQLPVCRGLCSS